MANSDGPEGHPPSAWVWSQYRGVAPDAPAAPVAHEPGAAAAPSADPTAPKNSAMIGLGLAAAIIVIAGLTWLFTTSPASSPARTETPPAQMEPAPAQKSEAPPHAETAAAPSPAAAGPAQEAPKAAPPDPAHHAKKKRR